MKRLVSRHLIVQVVSIALVSLGFAPLAHGGVASSRDFIAVESQLSQVDRIEAYLARQDVRDRLLQFGVSPDAVSARVQNLTPDEISRLSDSIDTGVAGGDALGLIGAVFLVLLILELVGVTNVFNAI